MIGSIIKAILEAVFGIFKTDKAEEIEVNDSETPEELRLNNDELDAGLGLSNDRPKDKDGDSDGPSGKPD